MNIEIQRCLLWSDLRSQAGSLAKEIEAKYGIKPKVKMAMGELKVLVDGKQVFSHKQEKTSPPTAELMQRIESARSQ